MNDEKEDKNALADKDNKNNLIGVDPLAWLSEEEKSSVLNQNHDTGSEAEGLEKADASTFCSINLNSSLTIREIAELMEELNSISTDKNELVFEAEQVERIDAAALQLLLGFYLFAIKEGRKITWNKPSETFCNAVNLLGLKDIINISPVSA